ACALHAVELNQREGRPGSRMVCVEPHPQPALRSLGAITLIEEPCQTVPDSVFEQLRAGDLLVIDSTHSVKVGSEVLRIYLDIIPKLPAGVYIFIHDIFLPYLYPRHTLFRFFAWQETALLLALLMGNRRLTVLASLSGLHYDRPDQLDSLL